MAAGGDALVRGYGDFEEKVETPLLSFSIDVSKMDIAAKNSLPRGGVRLAVKWRGGVSPPFQAE